MVGEGNNALIKRCVFLGAFAVIAVGLADAQTSGPVRAPAMKAKELKTALFGIRMEGRARLPA